MLANFNSTADGVVANQRQDQEHVRDRVRPEPAAGEAREGRRQPDLHRQGTNRRRAALQGGRRQQDCRPHEVGEEPRNPTFAHPVRITTWPRSFDLLPPCFKSHKPSGIPKQ